MPSVPMYHPERIVVSLDAALSSSGMGNERLKCKAVFPFDSEIPIRMLGL